VDVRCSLKPQLFLEPQCPGIRTGSRILSLLRKGWALAPSFVFLLWVALVRTHTKLVSSLAWLKWVLLAGLTHPVKLSLELCRPRPLVQALWRYAPLADGSMPESWAFWACAGTLKLTSLMLPSHLTHCPHPDLTILSIGERWHACHPGILRQWADPNWVLNPADTAPVGGRGHGSEGTCPQLGDGGRCVPWASGGYGVCGRRAAKGVILVCALLYFLYSTWWLEGSRQPQPAEVGVKALQGKARLLPGCCQVPWRQSVLCNHVVPAAACFLLLQVPVVFLSRGWHSVFQAVCGFLFSLSSAVLWAPCEVSCSFVEWR
jgi:hypothetical protein